MVSQDTGGIGGAFREALEELLLLRLQQPLAARMEVVPGRLGKPADRVLTEYCLKQFLAHDGGAACHADLQAR